MHQVIDGKTVYVVELTRENWPQGPVRGHTDLEAKYSALLGNDIVLGDGMYAKALTDALEKKIIVMPGKYGIHLVAGTNDYEIYVINE